MSQLVGPVAAPGGTSAIADQEYLLSTLDRLSSPLLDPFVDGAPSCRSLFAWLTECSKQLSRCCSIKASLTDMATCCRLLCRLKAALHQSFRGVQNQYVLELYHRWPVQLCSRRSGWPAHRQVHTGRRQQQEMIRGRSCCRYLLGPALSSRFTLVYKLDSRH